MLKYCFSFRIELVPSPQSIDRSGDICIADKVDVEFFRTNIHFNRGLVLKKACSECLSEGYRQAPKSKTQQPTLMHEHYILFLLLFKIGGFSDKNKITTKFYISLL